MLEITNNSKKVLLAEDDSTFRLLIKFKLEENSYETYIANDGQEAISLIEKIKPDLIICDIMMPYLSGLEILERTKNDLGYNMPFIIISSAGQEGMVMKAFELGAVDFLTKPFSINELLIRIKKNL